MQEAKKTKRKTEFERMFPGVQTDVEQQRHLTYLGKSYANYARDVATIKEMLNFTGFKIDKMDQNRLLSARVRAEMSCDMNMELMGENGKVFVCPKKQSKAPSEEFQINDLYIKYTQDRRDFFLNELEGAKHLYEQSIPETLNIIVKETKRFKLTPLDIGTKQAIVHVHYNLNDICKELHLDPKDVKQEVRDNYFDKLPKPSPQELLKKVNAPQAYAIFKKYEIQQGKIKEIKENYGTIHLDYGDAVAKLSTISEEFRKCTGYTIEKWKENGFTMSMLNWENQKTKKR